MEESRREFLRLAGSGVAAVLVPNVPHAMLLQTHGMPYPMLPFDLGIASYTFRSFTLDETIAMTKRLGVRKLTLKEMHLPLKSTDREIGVAREKIAAAGLELDGVGVIYMKTEEDIRRAFAYAEKAGARTIVGAPDVPLLPNVERFVRETDIILAIHNHGPTDTRYPTPESAYRSIETMDKRMGLCIDVGHTQRHGLDPSAEVERFIDRIYDIHVKDVDRSDASGKTVEVGRGVIDIPKLVRTLAKQKYSHTLHLEFEKGQKDPLAGTAESLGYIRGVMSTL